MEETLCVYKSPLCEEEALLVGRRPSVWGGGPLCSEEALCVEKRPSVRREGPLFREEALCVEMRPSVRGGGPLCGKEALCVERRPSIQRGGPLCGEEALCSGRRPSFWGGGSLLGIQGSLLGPILFLLFTNDLASYLDTKMVMYADDVQFLHLASPKHMSKLKSDVESTFDIASDWFVQNCLEINPTKTDLVVVKSQRRRLGTEFTVQFGGAMIRPSATTKILGVMVDSGLTFESHITAVIRRCYATLGGLSRSARDLPRDVKRMIVEMLIFPHIRYCMSVWSGCGVVQRHRIQKVINHCAQVVMGARRSAHVTPLLAELHWPHWLVAENDCSTVHYLLNNVHAPRCLSERFMQRRDVSSRQTRATENMQLELPRVRTEHARKFFNPRTAGGLSHLRTAGGGAHKKGRISKMFTILTEKDDLPVFPC